MQLSSPNELRQLLALRLAGPQAPPPAEATVTDIAPFVDLSHAGAETERRSLLALWRQAEREALLAGEFVGYSDN